MHVIFLSKKLSYMYFKSITPAYDVYKGTYLSSQTYPLHIHLKAPKYMI